MTEKNQENYCMECDAENDECNDALKYITDANQLRDSVIDYGKEIILIFFF